ncbi:DUF2782 domain-containing protein [Herbaspirillum sp. HC18]|nr:DUF2782 domain-containing protein [Herbaspirillum sp. HC18]
MCTYQARRRISAIIAIHAIALTAFAQEPPKLENLEEGEPPAVTIRKPEQKSRIEEKRAPGGRVTEVEVTSGGSSYVIKGNDMPGSTSGSDQRANTIRVPQWQIKEFSLGSPKGKEQEAAEFAAPPPPEALKPPASK